MKLTIRQLKKLIKEQIEEEMNEQIRLRFPIKLEVEEREGQIWLGDDNQGISFWLSKEEAITLGKDLLSLAKKF